MNSDKPYDLLFSAIVGEIDRARDWPLRVLAFTSVLHFGVLVAIISSKIEFLEWTKWALTGLFTILMIWTVIYFEKCHLNYLNLRNSQIELELKLGIKDGEIFPVGWLRKVPVRWCQRFWGWGYYAFIAISFWLAILGSVWLQVSKVGNP